MDDNTSLKLALGAVLVSGIIVFGFTHYNKENVTKAEESYLESLQKRDSLENVVDSLQTEIFMLEDGFDFKEHRYEDIMFEYELGLSYLKEYHPNAYKDFHRIIGMKERYSTQLEKENGKRLKQYKEE